ncbi:MAG: O-antigen ligase C-terminal domain-containing protein [Burkholderiales bacterium]|nr:O-antigen ligase C-terminal domain-containing protein [Burkholderiales bacterium]
MQISLLTLAGMALVLASWLMPLHILPWVSWHSEVPAFLAVFLLVLGGLTAWVGRVRGTTLRISLPVSMLFWLALCLLVLLQWISGQIGFAGDALVLGLYFALCSLAWGLGYVANLADRAKDLLLEPSLEIVAWTLLAGASASAVIAMAQAFDVWETAGWITRMPQLRRPGGNIGQPNQLATLLVMGIVSLLFLHQYKRMGRYVAGMLLLMLAVGLAATESRAGLLSITVLVILWWRIGRSHMGLRVKPWFVIAAFMVFLALYVSWPSMMSQADPLAQAVQVNTKVGMRLVVWPQLMEAIALRPWAGWGLREVPAAHNAVVSEHATSEPWSYAHNLVLDLALGVGIPLTIVILGGIALWLRRRLIASVNHQAWYCIAAVLPVAVHSLFEFPFAYAYFLAPAMFLLGSWEAMTGAKACLHVRIKTAAVFVALISAVAAWSVIEYVRIEEDFRVVRFESLRLGKTPVDHERPRVLLLTQLDALLHAGRIEPGPDMSPETIELARKTAMRYPWPATQNRYALSLALNGQPEEALRQLRVIRAQHGEWTYGVIRENWQTLGREKHAALLHLHLP